MGRRKKQGRKKKQSKKALEEIQSLPCDIIYIILSKLPVKSLLRFRCVCNSLRLLISQPEFRKTHLNQSIKLDHQRLFCISSNLPNWYYSIGYETSDHSNEKLYLPPYKFSGELKNLCSCNCLVLFCIGKDRNWVLWNPSTREYIDLSCPYYSEFSLCGLCYDSSIDDYKVVFISSRPLNGEPFYVVFSLKANSWTKFTEFTHSPILNEIGVNVNGVFHFIAESSKYPSSSSDDDDDDDDVYYNRTTYTNIVFFDAVNEKFEEMPPPPIDIDRKDRKDVFGLIDVKGCLGLYCSTPDKEQAEVWVMKEHGEMSSWTKLFLIPLRLRTTPWEPYMYWTWKPYLRPWCVTKKCEIVMGTTEKNIVIYNPKENTFRSLKNPKHMKNYFRVLPFVDSLVLPNPNKLIKSKIYCHQKGIIIPGRLSG